LAARDVASFDDLSLLKHVRPSATCRLEVLLLPLSASPSEPQSVAASVGRVWLLPPWALSQQTERRSGIFAPSACRMENTAAAVASAVVVVAVVVVAAAADNDAAWTSVPAAAAAATSPAAWMTRMSTAKEKSAGYRRSMEKKSNSFDQWSTDSSPEPSRDLQTAANSTRLETTSVVRFVRHTSMDRDRA
jgi:hypothetical protein